MFSSLTEVYMYLIISDSSDFRKQKRGFLTLRIAHTQWAQEEAQARGEHQESRGDCGFQNFSRVLQVSRGVRVWVSLVASYPSPVGCSFLCCKNENVG